MIHLSPVESSTIQAVGYDAEAQELHVRFLASPDRRYVYKGVPAEVARAFEAAESKGSFFNRWIKPLYPFEQRAETAPLARDAVDAYLKKEIERWHQRQKEFSGSGDHDEYRIAAVVTEVLESVRRSLLG